MSQVDYFLQIDGIEGDSQDAQHKGAIVVQSWSWSQATPVNLASGTSGAATGKVALQPMQFTMSTSSASPKLFLAEVAGQVFKTATLTGRQPGKNANGFLKITLQSVIVSAFGTSSTDSDQLPIDHLTLSYGALEYAFTPQKADGSPATPITAGWNTVTNQASSATP
ncbi:Hcp family type VI secretion system effector [Stenomitos frigidus]|uniref:Type VI secretion system tube protein Hcp n=1 Tax=Stenomitos frigidus ULC18 TaxID=2107698 RepID=A0A2T1DU28_9CYAN|nr:type VI secretion system tube protein Hcp [Stenomitos frigidus]PSB24009.1 hypothetical protein C7B82_28755 [Stenomitos frigidus ULC18]